MENKGTLLENNFINSSEIMYKYRQIVFSNKRKALHCTSGNCNIKRRWPSALACHVDSGRLLPLTEINLP